jgi:hypothetical protein
VVSPRDPGKVGIVVRVDCAGCGRQVQPADFVLLDGGDIRAICAACHEATVEIQWPTAPARAGLAPSATTLRPS